MAYHTNILIAKWCFQRGIELRRVVVIPDDPDDIKETVLDLAKRVDLVYTSGGIGKY
jgi:molybdopterin-biosynthesis enzyme MoeA-like protein